MTPYIDESSITVEEQRITDVIVTMFKNNEMSSEDVANRLHFLKEYSAVAKKSLKYMQDLEVKL
jgi:hypothetical protein